MLMAINRIFGNLALQFTDEQQQHDVSPRLVNTSLRYKLADAFSKPFNNELRLSAISSNRIAILRERVSATSQPRPSSSPVAFIA